MISAGLPIDSKGQQSYSYCNNRIRNLQGWVKFPIGGKAREPKGRIR